LKQKSLLYVINRLLQTCKREKTKEAIKEKNRRGVQKSKNMYASSRKGQQLYLGLVEKRYSRYPEEARLIAISKSSSSL
jgi:hypothetical protein